MGCQDSAHTCRQIDCMQAGTMCWCQVGCRDSADSCNHVMMPAGGAGICSLGLPRMSQTAFKIEGGPINLWSHNCAHLGRCQQ